MFSKTEFTAKFEAFRTKHSCTSPTLLVASSSAGVGTNPAPAGAAGHTSLSPAAIKLARAMLAQISTALEVDLDLDHEALLAIFARPADAVKFSVGLHTSLRAMAEESAHKAFDRIGVHAWKMQGADLPTAVPAPPNYGKELQLTIGLSQLAAPHQILLTPLAFETARQVIRKEDFGKMAPPSWLAHGPYSLTHLQLQTELHEIGETGASCLTPPKDSEAAHPLATAEDPLVWGWRPGPGASVPGTRCVLESRLADSRFGEVWAGVDTMVKEKKMFKFCFRKDWAHALKEAEPAFQLVKKKLSQARNVLAIQATSLDQAPFYIQCELFEGKDLHSWCRERGGVGAVQFSSRLELVAQAAAGLQAAHEAKILHQDIRPENILVFGTGESARHVQVKVTDFQSSHVGLQVPYVDETPEPESTIAATADAAKSNATATVPAKPDAPAVETAAPAASVPGDPYLAPELLEGKPASPKTDIYALGVVLAQLVLGRFTNALLPERLKEVLAVVKRPALIPVVAEKPEERAESAGLFVGELRNAVKERDSRTHEQKTITPKILARNIAIGALAVIAAVLLVQQVPQWLSSDDSSPKLRAVDSKKAPAKPPEVRKTQSDTSGLALTDTPAEGETGNTVVQVGDQKASSSRRVIARKEEKPEIGSGVLLYLVLPTIMVLALGYGMPRVYHLLHDKKSKTKPDSKHH